MWVSPSERHLPKTTATPLQLQLHYRVSLGAGLRGTEAVVSCCKMPLGAAGSGGAYCWAHQKGTSICVAIKCWKTSLESNSDGLLVPMGQVRYWWYQRALQSNLKGLGSTRELQQEVFSLPLPLSPCSASSQMLNVWISAIHRVEQHVLHTLRAHEQAQGILVQGQQCSSCLWEHVLHAAIAALSHCTPSVFVTIAW